MSPCPRCGVPHASAGSSEVPCPHCGERFAKRRNRRAAALRVAALAYRKAWGEGRKTLREWLTVDELSYHARKWGRGYLERGTLTALDREARCPLFDPCGERGCPDCGFIAEYVVSPALAPDVCDSHGGRAGPKCSPLTCIAWDAPF